MVTLRQVVTLTSERNFEAQDIHSKQPGTGLWHPANTPALNVANALIGKLVETH